MFWVVNLLICLIRFYGLCYWMLFKLLGLFGWFGVNFVKFVRTCFGWLVWMFVGCLSIVIALVVVLFCLALVGLLVCFLGLGWWCFGVGLLNWLVSSVVKFLFSYVFLSFVLSTWVGFLIAFCLLVIFDWFGYCWLICLLWMVCYFGV